MTTKRKYRYRLQCEKKRISTLFNSRQNIDEIDIVSDNIENEIAGLISDGNTKSLI